MRSLMRLDASRSTAVEDPQGVRPSRSCSRLRLQRAGAGVEVGAEVGPLRAVDPALNRDALGAVVTVTAGGRTLTRTIIAASSYASSCQPIAHFGLGDVTGVDRITVRWPDGFEEQFDGVPFDRHIELHRGAGASP